MGFFDSGPRIGTEAYRVEQEVKKRKKIAEEKGVRALITGLYFGKLEYYPSWIKQSGGYVPKAINEAKEEKNGERKITTIAFFGKTYKFEFSQHSFSTPDDFVTHGLLELFFGEKRILGINVALEHGTYDSEWRPFDIAAFIDGDWIDDFSRLKEEIKKNDKLREQKKAEDPRKVQDLKNNFGID